MDGDAAVPTGDRPCELCGRCGIELTQHHLIPRSRHKNRRNKREFDRREVRQRIAWLCRPCHNQIHDLLNEKSLERDFNTMALLRGHPGLARFAAWIVKRPAGTSVPGHGRSRR